MVPSDLRRKILPKVTPHEISELQNLRRNLPENRRLKTENAPLEKETDLQTKQFCDSTLVFWGGNLPCFSSVNFNIRIPTKVLPSGLDLWYPLCPDFLYVSNAQNLCWVGYRGLWSTILRILPSLKKGLPNRKVVFQPSISRGYVSFQEGNNQQNGMHPPWNQQLALEEIRSKVLFCSPSIFKGPFVGFREGFYYGHLPRCFQN